MESTIENILQSKYDKYLEGLDIYENKSSLRLTKIIIKPEFRQSGIGKQIMTDLNVDEDDILMSVSFSLLELISENAFHKNDIVSNEKCFIEKELPIEAMQNLIGYINNPIGRRKYPKEVVDNVQVLDKWIKENIKMS
jgi:hypothetical protein